MGRASCGAGPVPRTKEPRTAKHTPDAILDASKRNKKTYNRHFGESQEYVNTDYALDTITLLGSERVPPMHTLKP